MINPHPVLAPAAAIILALAGGANGAAAKTPAPVTAARAAAIADHTARVWAAIDAARMKAIDVPDVVAFDFS